MDNQLLKTEFYNQLKLGEIALKNKKYKVSFYHFENAHILGQKNIMRHALSHFWMLYFGIKSKNSKEIIGQVPRIMASIVCTLFWIPVGNTGGSNVSPLKSIPVRKELRKFF